MDDLMILKETGLSREELDMIREAYRNAPSATPGYSDYIKGYSLCSDAVVGAVEDIMRNEVVGGGCLDHLSAKEFRGAAITAFNYYEYIMGKQIIMA